MPMNSGSNARAPLGHGFTVTVINSSMICPRTAGISKTGHQVLSSHDNDPDKNYWRNKQKTPAKGRGNL